VSVTKVSHTHQRAEGEVSQKKAKNVLTDFGLTSKEADVYMFLARREVLTGGEIAKQTKIARSLVYRILKSLQSKGLVEPTLEVPKRFVAVPFEKALDLIIKTRQEEALLVERAKEDLLEDWRVISKAKPEAKYEKFVVIEGTKKIYAKILNMVRDARNQLSGILPVSALARAEQIGVFEAVTQHPLKNRIRFQFITEVNSQNAKAMKLLKPKLKAELDLKARNLESEITSFPIFVIRDKEEAMIFIRPEVETATEKQGDVCIYTNCESLVQTFNGIFKNLWQTSTDLTTKISEIETGKLPKTDLISRERIAEKTLETAEGFGLPKKPGIEDEFTQACVSKIHLLNEEERGLLEIASIVGEEFSSEMIENVTGYSRARVLQTLANIERGHKLISSVGDRYRFDNPKIREILYNEIKPKLKRVYHSLSAKLLEEANRDHLDDFIGELAHQYYQSGNAQKAIPYLLKAGQYLRRNFEFLKAIEYLSEALEMMGNENIWREERTTALENLGDLHASIGEYEKANKFYVGGIAAAKDEVTGLRIERKIRRKRIIEKGGAKIQYYVYGEGEPTILLVWYSIHFMAQIQHFSQNHRVAIMDFEDAWEFRNLPSEYIVDLYTENLRAIVEDLQASNIFLVGIGVGGTVAIHYIAKYPGKVAKLALAATPPIPLISEAEGGKKRLEEFWVLALKDPIWGLNNLYGRVMGRPWSGPLPREDQFSKLQKIWWAVNKVPVEIRLIMNKILFEADVRPLLGKITVPTLILHGENDMLPLEGAKCMKERIPNSQLHIFEDAALVSLSMPDEFNKVLEEFLTVGKVTAD
jgi:sugar-specific transcriptional regulator TrmB/pimeloyl-ACP methyl ester carboxylesterase